MALARLGDARPDVLEIDLNPVIASATAAIAVDALVVLARGRRSSLTSGRPVHADTVGRPADAQPAGQAQRPERSVVRALVGGSTPPRPTRRPRHRPRGRGRAFSSGYDLTEEAGARSAGRSAWRDLLAADVAATLQFLDSPKPVIAQGPRLRARRWPRTGDGMRPGRRRRGTKLGEPEIRYGSAPVTLLMPFLIGQKNPQLLLTEDLIDAAEAERIGLVNRIVPAGGLVGEVDALADRLARTAEVMAPTKRIINRAMDAAASAWPSRPGSIWARSSTRRTPRSSAGWDAIVRRDGLKERARVARSPLRGASRQRPRCRRDRDGSGVGLSQPAALAPVIRATPHVANGI